MSSIYNLKVNGVIPCVLLLVIMYLSPRSVCSLGLLVLMNIGQQTLVNIITNSSSQDYSQHVQTCICNFLSFVQTGLNFLEGRYRCAFFQP